METDVERFAVWSEETSPRPLSVVLVGAGNLTHVIAGLLGARDDVAVSILSRKAQDIQHAVANGITVYPNPIRKLGSKDARGAIISDIPIVGKVKKISSDPSEVIPGADVILITVPSNARPGVLKQIAPYLPHKGGGDVGATSGRAVLLGGLPGLGGFDWVASAALRHAFGPKGNPSVIVWALKDVPYMCTRTIPGVSVDNLGAKKAIYLGLAPGQERHQDLVMTIVERLFSIPVIVLPHFLAITLTPGNPIMHPSIMYGMFGPRSQWDGKPLPERPLFYEACGELSAYILEHLDDEVQDIKVRLEREGGVDLSAVMPLRVNLKAVYGDDVADNRTLLLALRTNKTYATVRTPLLQVDGGFVPTPHHRFFEEDVPFGLCVLKGLAEIAQVKTPYMDTVLAWAQDFMGKQYLVDGRLSGADAAGAGHPQRYGFFTVSQIARGAPADVVSKL